MSNQAASHPAIDCKSLSELIATVTTDGAAHAGGASKKSLVFILGSAGVENSVFVKSKSKTAPEYTVKDCASRWCLDSNANDTLLLSICSAGAQENVSVLNCGMFCSNEAVKVENGNRFYAPFGSVINPVEDMLAHTAGIKHGIEATHMNTATTLIIIGLKEHEKEVLNIVAGLNLCEIVYWSASPLNLIRNRECKHMSQVVGQVLSPVTTTKNCPYKFFAGLNALNINCRPNESFRGRLRTGIMRVNVETVNAENAAKLNALKMYYFGPNADSVTMTAQPAIESMDSKGFKITIQQMEQTHANAIDAATKQAEQEKAQVIETVVNRMAQEKASAIETMAKQKEQEKASAIEAVVNRMEQEKASAIEAVVNRMEQDKVQATKAAEQGKAKAVEQEKASALEAAVRKMAQEKASAIETLAKQMEQEKASAIQAVVNRMEQEKASAIEAVVHRMEQEKASAIETVVREKSSAVENDKEAALQSKNAVIESMQKTFSETITSATQGLAASVRELEKQLDQNNRAANVAHEQQMTLLSEKDKIIDKLMTKCASKDNEIRELKVANNSSSSSTHSSSSSIANPTLTTQNTPSAPVVNRVTAPVAKKKRSAPASSKKTQAKKIKDVKLINKNKKEGFKNWLKASVQKIKKSDDEVKRYTCKSLHMHCKVWCHERGLTAPSDRGDVRFKDLMNKAGYAHGCTNSGSNFYKSIKAVNPTAGLIECNMARKVTTPKV